MAGNAAVKNTPANQVLVNQSSINQLPSSQPPVKPPRRPGRVTQFIEDRFLLWGKWTIGVLFAGFAIVILLLYLAVQWITYTTLVWGNGTNTAVTLVQDIGHGGVSEITVTFSNHTLLVSEVDNNDPSRVTVMKVNEEIALPEGSSVLTASLQPVLQSDRLDLVIKLKGGLAYHTLFTTILINNVDAIRTNPQAPGLRVPTAAELNQALQRLGG
jgi:hypothetical protein